MSVMIATRFMMPIRVLGSILSLIDHIFLNISSQNRIMLNKKSHPRKSTPVWSAVDWFFLDFFDQHRADRIPRPK